MGLYVIWQCYAISGMANTKLVHIWEHQLLHIMLSSCYGPTAYVQVRHFYYITLLFLRIFSVNM